MKGSITTKGKRYYPVFDIGRDPATGKRRQKWGPGFRTKREAETWLTEAVNQVNKGIYTPRTKETVAEWTSEQVEERFESVFGSYETGYESTFTVSEHEFLRDLTDDEREELR